MRKFIASKRALQGVKDNSSGRKIKSEGNTNLPKRNEEHQNDESVNEYNVYFV